MHRWSASQKRAMLAAMLVPWALVLAGCVALGVVFEHRGGPEWAAAVTAVCFVGGFLLALVTALACLADALRDRRIEPRADRRGWSAALLLAPAVAGPTYWWLHARQRDGEPHGLSTLRPAWQWSPRVKALVGLGTLFTLVFFLAWSRFMETALDFGDSPLIVPGFSGLGAWTPVASVVLALLFLDALRAGGRHTRRWGVLLVLGWALTAPVYWLLFVRPTGRPDGGP